MPPRSATSATMPTQLPYSIAFTNYQDEVVNWCQEALQQAELCKNTSGKQWVTAMLASFYKRNGQFNKALDLFQQSIDETQARQDDYEHTLNHYLQNKKPSKVEQYLRMILQEKQAFNEKTLTTKQSNYNYNNNNRNL